MYFTTQPATAPLYHYDAFAFLVGTSVCIGDDLGDWSDLGPMWSSYRTYQSGPDQTNKVESPHLFKHGGQWYLFFTGEQGIYYLTGPNPVGDIPVHAGLWTYQGLLEETLPSEFASEAFRARWADGTTEDYFATVRSTGAYKFIIQFRAFNPSGSAPLLVDPLMPREVRPLRAGVVEGETLGVALRTELPSVGGTLGITMQRSAPITVFEVDESNGERSLSIIDPASIGMPSVAHVTTNYLAGDDGDTLRFVARWLPDDDDTPNRDEVVIRVRGFDSAVLAIQRAGTGQVLGVDSQALQANRVTLSPIGSAAGGSEARLRAGVPRSGVVKLEIFDAGGRRVRMLARGWRDAGFHEERWDGRDDGGKRTPSGVYFARLTTPDGSASARVARLR
jgi:hypothetical protein